MNGIDFVKAGWLGAEFQSKGTKKCVETILNKKMIRRLKNVYGSPGAFTRSLLRSIYSFFSSTSGELVF